MKNYDDLQRFKEKTHTLDIAFKDMSGQAQESAEQSKWALIRQLAKDEPAATLGSGQRIDLPQPHPLRGDEFRAAPQPMFSVPSPAAPLPVPDNLTDSRSLIGSAVNSNRASLFPPPPEVPAVADPVVTLRPALVQTASLTDSEPRRVSPAGRPEPGHFGALFRARDTHLPKETLLKPLLEKIALCR